MPEHIVILLHAVTILLGYGRHLLDTVRQRATAPHFTTIVVCFGTANLSTILAHLNRGLLRAAALERMLLARAATGRDIDIVTPRIRMAEAQPAPQDAQPEQPATAKAALRPSRPIGRNDPERFMPTQEELELQVRRCSVGRTMVDICLDLAVVPGFCTSAFWNELFEIIQCFGGRVATLMQEKSRREQAFAQQQDKIQDSNWQWLHRKRDVVRQVFGFFIGETPCVPAAALATGPP